MKNTIKFMIGALAIGMVSCEPEFENSVNDEGFYDAGDANFSNYVAVGNSLTAGFADGALYITGQEDSYPNIMAQQFDFVGGGDFTQPLMSDNLGGLLLGGQPIPDLGTDWFYLLMKWGIQHLQFWKELQLQMFQQAQLDLSITWVFQEQKVSI